MDRAILECAGQAQGRYFRRPDVKPNPHQQHLLDQLAAFRDAQQRLAWLVEQSRPRPGLAAELKSEANRVAGCLAQLWLVAAWPEGRGQFRCDSDSQVTRAVAGFLCDFFSGCLPGEILATTLGPIEQAGLGRQLTPNRRNALRRVWERLRAEAAQVAGASPPPRPDPTPPLPGAILRDANENRTNPPA